VRWLTSLPLAVLVVGSVALAVLVAAGSRRAVIARVPEDERGDIATIAGPLLPVLGATFAVLAGVTLASEAGYLRNAQDDVSAEAAQASRLGWASTSPGVRSEPIQSALVDYLRATRANEWRELDEGKRADDETAEAIAALEQAVRSESARSELGTPAGTELLASLDGLTVARRARLAAAERGLPGLYVITLTAGGLALVGTAGALAYRTRSRAQEVLVAGLAGVVGLSLALLLAIAGPWAGPLVVSGTSIDAVVRDIEAGYFAR
jgi:hypothetical protein